MKTVGIAALKSELSRYLEIVKRGGELIVTEHGVPVARIQPVALIEDTYMKRLAGDGVVRLPERKHVKPQPSTRDQDGRLLAALLSERETGL